jgi:hypothetical protein
MWERVSVEGGVSVVHGVNDGQGVSVAVGQKVSVAIRQRVSVAVRQRVSVDGRRISGPPSKSGGGHKGAVIVIVSVGEGRRFRYGAQGVSSVGHNIDVRQGVIM